MLVGNGQTILIFWNAKHSYHFASWPGAGRQGQIGLSQGGFGSPSCFGIEIIPPLARFGFDRCSGRYDAW